MTQTLSFMSKAILGPGAILEDANPTPPEVRTMKGAKSTAPVEAVPLINSQDDKTLSLPLEE